MSGEASEGHDLGVVYGIAWISKIHGVQQMIRTSRFLRARCLMLVFYVVWVSAGAVSLPSSQKQSRRWVGEYNTERAGECAQERNGWWPGHSGR